MTASIPHTLTLLEDAFADLPKDKADLPSYDDSALERIEVLTHNLTALRDQCLYERNIRPGITIAGPVHPELIADAVKQAHRNRN